MADPNINPRAGGDWKVTLAKWAYFIALYNIENWRNGDDSPDDTEYDVLYRGVTNGHLGYENALNGTAIPRGEMQRPDSIMKMTILEALILLGLLDVELQYIGLIEILAAAWS